ncbi:MAG: hypothetical protein AAB418_02345 [candidate division NC10 bacterium]|jgi:hypothetical protein
MAELTRKYVVMALASESAFDLADPDAAFVLKPWKDPAALRALIVYRDNCYPELSRELDVWIRTIEAGPVVRGDVGKLNEPHVRRAAARKPAPRRRAAVKHARRAAHRKKRK